MTERLLARALEQRAVSEEDLLEMKSNGLEKQAVAWLLKTNTMVTGVWLANRPNLGHSSNVSCSLRAFREARSKKVRKRKGKMTKCKA